MCRPAIIRGSFSMWACAVPTSRGIGRSGCFPEIRTQAPHRDAPPERATGLARRTARSAIVSSASMKPWRAAWGDAESGAVEDRHQRAGRPAGGVVGIAQSASRRIAFRQRAHGALVSGKPHPSHRRAVDAGFHGGSLRAGTHAFFLLLQEAVQCRAGRVSTSCGSRPPRGC